MAAGDQRYSRNYLLKTSLEAHDEASETFGQVGLAAEDLEKKLESLERKYNMGLELLGAKEVKRETQSVDKELDNLDGRTATATVKIKRDKSWDRLEKDQMTIERMKESLGSLKTNLDSSDARDSIKTMDRMVKNLKANAEKIVWTADNTDVIKKGKETLDVIESFSGEVHHFKIEAKGIEDAKNESLKLAESLDAAGKRREAKIESNIDEQIDKAKVLHTRFTSFEREFKGLISISEKDPGVIRRMQTDLNDMESRVRTARIAVQVLGENAPDELKADLDALNGAVATAKVALDDMQFQATESGIRRELAAIDATIVEATAGVQFDQGSLAAANAQLRTLENRVYKARVEAETFGFPQAAAQLQSLQSLVGTMRDRVIRLRAESDVGGAIGGIKLLEAAAKHIERTYHIRVDTSNLSVAKAALLSTVAAGQQAGQAFSSLAVNMSSLMQVAGVLRAAMTILVTVFAALAVAAAGPLLAALAILAATLTAVAGGIILLVAAAAPLAASFAASAGAAEKQAQANNTLRNSAQAVESAQRGLAQAEQAASDARIQAAEGVATAIENYNDSLVGVQQAERAVEDARVQANENSAAAIKAYSDSLEQVEAAERSAMDARVQAADRASQAQRSYNDAVRQVQSSERGLVDARNQLRSATETLVQAQEDLNQAMQREPTRLAEGELSLRDAQLAQAESTNRIAEAQQRLNELDPSASAAERQAAELAIQRAQLEQERSVLNLQNAQFDYNELVSEGSSELQGAAKAVESASAQEEAARLGISEAEYQLLKAREDASLAYNDIAKTDAENTRDIADADRALLDAREDSAAAYDNISKVQTEGARSIEDAEISLAQSRKESQRAYEGIAKAQAQGARQIADADAAVVEAQERVNDALEDYNVAAAKAAKETGGLASMISELPPAIQPLAWAFLEAFGPASEVMAQIFSQANDIAIQALPSIGVAAYDMAIGFQSALNTIGMAWQTSGVLTSMQTILGYIPSITTAFSTGMGYALGGLINILALAMPFAERVAFWVRDIGLRFLEWTASQAGREAIMRFFASAAPLIQTIGYWAWEIAKAIVNWSVEHAWLISAAIDLLGRGLMIAGSFLGPVVSWLLQFAVAHPWVLGVAIAAVGVGTAIAGIAFAVAPVIAILTGLWGVGTAVFGGLSVVAGALGLTTGTFLVVAFSAAVAAMLVLINVGFILYDNWNYIVIAANWVATNVPLAFWTIVDWLSATFLPTITTVMYGFLAPIAAPFVAALDYILSYFGLSLGGIITSTSEWLTTAWPTIGQAIINALPAPFRFGVQSIVSMVDWLWGYMEPSGEGIGASFARGLMNGLKNINPIIGAQVSIFERAWGGIKSIVSTETDEATTTATSEFAALNTDTAAILEEIKATTDAQMSATNSAISTHLQQAQYNGTFEMGTLNANSNASMNDLYNSALTNMQNTNLGVSGELNAAQIAGSGSMSLLNADGTVNMEALNANSVSNMQGANYGITGNLSDAQVGGTGSMNTLQTTGAAAANEAFKTFTHPFWEASVSVQHALNAMLYGMSQVISRAGLNVTPPESFTVMHSVEQFAGGNGSLGGRALGGVYDANNNPIYMHSGGKINPASTKKQGSTGGMANGKTPRVVYGEAKSEEAYVVKNRPTAEQMPYLQTAASWHGAEVVPKSTGAGVGSSGKNRDKHRRGHGKTAWMARGGLLSVGGFPVVPMYGGGFWDTHYDVMPEIATRANAISASTGASWNTYGGHGSLGGALEEYTVDFWGGDRGVAIPYDTGNAVFSEVMGKYAEDLMYIIWDGTLYNAYGQFADDEHFDHVHVSWGGAGGFSASGGGVKSAQVASLIKEELPDSLIASTPGATAGGTLDQISTGIQTDMLGEVRTATQALAPKGGNGGPLSDEELRAAIAEGMQLGGVMPMSMLDDMVAKAIEESSGIPDAVNNWDINAMNGTPSQGLFQIIESTWNNYMDELTGGYENVFDPVKNTAVASRIMMAQAGQVQFGAYKRGGVITQPHLGLVGEAGPEAVLPLNDHRAMAQVGDSIVEAQARGGVRKKKPLPVDAARAPQRSSTKAGKKGKGKGKDPYASQYGKTWNQVPHLMTQEQADRQKAAYEKRQEAANAAQYGTSASNPSMDGTYTGEAGAMPVTDSGTYEGLSSAESQLGALNEENDVQTENLANMGSCSCEHLGSIDSTAATQSDQLSGLQTTEDGQAVTMTGIADTGIEQSNTLHNIEMTENTQSEQLSGLQTTEDYHSAQYAGLQETAATDAATNSATYGETAYQTTQLADIAATEDASLQATNTQLSAANQSLNAIEGNTAAMATADATGPYAQAGGVTAGPGTGTSSSYSGGTVNANNSVQNHNVQMYQNTQNTGKTQGKNASINVSPSNTNGAARNASYGTAPTTSQTGALPVTDVGTQSQLAQQGAALGRIESNDIQQTQSINQVATDSTQQTEQLGSLEQETGTQTTQLQGIEGETSTQTGEISNLTTTTAAGDTDIATVLQASLEVQQQMSALLGEIAASTAATAASSGQPSAVDPAALDAADEQRALVDNFGG